MHTGKDWKTTVYLLRVFIINQENTGFNEFRGRRRSRPETLSKQANKSRSQSEKTQEAQGKGRSKQTLMQRAGQVNKDRVKLIRAGQTTTVVWGGRSGPADIGRRPPWREENEI